MSQGTVTLTATVAGVGDQTCIVRCNFKDASGSTATAPAPTQAPSGGSSSGSSSASGLELSRFGLVYDASGRTSDPDIYGAGDVSGTSPIWPAAVKQGIIAASNMAGVERKQTDFFASKSTMNFLGIPSMSLGDVNGDGPDLTVEVREDKKSYKKIVHKHGRIVGAILQGDLAYGGILQQLIAHKIDVSKVKKPVFDIDYSDFFHMDDNFEFYYDQ